MQNGVFGNILYNKHTIFGILILFLGKCYATVRRILVISPREMMLQSVLNIESMFKKKQSRPYYNHNYPVIPLKNCPAFSIVASASFG